ncbi:MAG TPA: AAA family ATPase [Vitreimonas sp.]|nr:AAA family ATPase [Vitreimonas sp.]
MSNITQAQPKMQLRKAQKQKAKLRMGLAGTSGSGKTFSALLLASGLTSWDKICVIDTENGSADLYDHLGDYNVLPLTAPFSPERYIEAVKACEEAGAEVIIIDSITHEWDGKGGCLEIVEKLGGRYQDWSKVTPRHTAFIESILQSTAHIITTVRRKQDYEMTKDNNGKIKVEKAGLKEITREGFEYELTLSFAISQNHYAVASKDRTGLFMDKPEFVISPETGLILKNWSESGVTEILIQESQLMELEKLLDVKGKRKEPLLEFYKVESLDKLTLKQAQAAISKLKTYEDAPPEPSEEELGRIDGDQIAEEVEAGLEAAKKANTKESNE